MNGGQNLGREERRSVGDCSRVAGELNFAYRNEAGNLSDSWSPKPTSILPLEPITLTFVSQFKTFIESPFKETKTRHIKKADLWCVDGSPSCSTGKKFSIG